MDDYNSIGSVVNILCFLTLVYSSNPVCGSRVRQVFLRVRHGVGVPKVCKSTFGACLFVRPKYGHSRKIAWKFALIQMGITSSKMGVRSSPFHSVHLLPYSSSLCNFRSKEEN